MYVVARARRPKSQRSVSSPGARVETAGAAARNEPARKRGDGGQDVQVTAMVPIQLSVLGSLACRLLVKVLVWVAWMEQFSVPVPVPRSSAPS